MGAFGKTLTACTLAFGTLGSGLSGNWGGYTPHQPSYKHDDGKSKHASYDNKDWKTGKSYYDLKWDDQRKLCNDDHYWLTWSKKSGDSYWDRGNYCKHGQDHKKDYGHNKQADWKKDNHKDNYGYDKKSDWNKYDWKKDDHKRDDKKDYGHDYGMKDWNDHDWDKKDYGHNDKKVSYHKNEEAKKYFSQHEEKHEKKYFALAADYDFKSKDHKDYGKDDCDYGHDKNYGKYDQKYDWNKGNYGHDYKDYGSKHYDKDYDNDYGKDVRYDDHKNDYKDDYKRNDTHAKVYVATDKDVEATNKAQTNQAVVVNNYNYIHGDNNVINNNISVENKADTEQKASASQSTQASLNYNNEHNDGYNKGYDWNKGGYDDYGKDHYKNDEASVKVASKEEKDYSNDVKKAESYKLDETYKQSDQKQHDGYDHEDYDWDGDHNDWSGKQKEEIYQ